MAIEFNFLSFDYADGFLRVTCHPVSQELVVRGRTYAELVQNLRERLRTANVSAEDTIVALLTYWYLERTGSAAAALANKALLLSSTFVLDFTDNTNLIKRQPRA